MKIGFIGAGVVAQTISKHVLAVGHRVLLSNTKGPDSIAPLVKELGSGAEAGTAQQAQSRTSLFWPQTGRRCNRRYSPFPIGKGAFFLTQPIGSLVLRR